MKRLSAIPVALLAAGCLAYQPPVQYKVKFLHSADRAEREKTFLEFLQGGEEVVPNLRRFLAEGQEFGFPMAALLYHKGRGDLVPIEIKVSHLARYEWPADLTTQKTLDEPYVWRELEHDLARIGRPALRPLAEALARETPDEARSMRVVQALLLVGGPSPEAAVAELEKLLGSDRKAGTVRVADVAAAVILHLLYQDVVLAQATDLPGEAKRALESLRGLPEEDWIRKGAERAGDAADWKDYRSMMADFVAADVPPADPARALDTHPWGADRLLERQMRVRLRRFPDLRKLDDLKDVRRHPVADPCLPLKWRRWVESAMIKLVIAKAGLDRKTNAPGLLGFYEQRFHCTADKMEYWESVSGGQARLLFVQSLDLGTAASVGEFTWDEKNFFGGVQRPDIQGGAPSISFPAELKDCTIIAIEDAPVPVAGPPPPVEKQKEWLVDLLRKRLDRAGSAGPSARALAYLGATAAAPDLLRAGETLESPEEAAAVAGAMILLGFPEGLDLAGRRKLTVTLARHELDWAAAAAKDPKLKAWIQAQTPRP